MLLLDLGLAEAHLRQFGLAVGNMRQRPVVDPGRQAEERVAQHDAGLVGGGVSELRSDGGVADGVDPPVAGAQPAVDGDAGGAVLDTGALEIELGQVGAAAHGNQQVRAHKSDRVALSLDRNA